MAEQGALTRDRSAAPERGPSDRFRPIPVTRETRDDGSIVLRSTEPLGDYPDCFHDMLFKWAQAVPGRTFLAERVPGKEGWAAISYGEAAEKVEEATSQAQPAIAAVEPAAAAPVVVPAPPKPQTLTITFDVNSSYLPDDLNGRLRALAQKLEADRSYQVESSQGPYPGQRAAPRAAR